MTYDEARLLLLMHGPGTEDAEGRPLIARDGFTSSLRPYSGLVESNFHLVMEALLTVGEKWYREQLIDRELVWAIWVICLAARHDGLHPDGMLQRNKIITPADTKRLTLWVDALECSALTILAGHAPHSRLERYAEYVTNVGWWDNIGFFIPLFERAISDPNLSEPETVVKALGKVGSRARSTLPTLYQALAREYTYYSPHDRCTEEVRGVIRQAIHSIESDLNGNSSCDSLS